VLSQRHASIQLPSMPVHRSAIQHHADNIFIGCVAPSHEQGDIVAVDVADVHTYIVPFPLLHLHCCRSCITFEVAFGKLDEKSKSETCKKRQFSEWGEGWGDTSDDWLVKLMIIIIVIIIIIDHLPGPPDQNACVVNTWPDQFTTATK